MKIEQKYLPPNTLRRPNIKNNGIKFIVCHDTGNDGSTALQNVNYYINSANEVEASAHTFIDDKGAIECIPQDEKAYHVRRVVTKDNELYGFDSIDNSLGIELCFSTKGVFDSKLAYANYVEYIKGLCTKYNLDPRKHLISHQALDPTRRTDPINAFMKIGKTWDMFINDVAGQQTIDKTAIKKQIIDLVNQL